MFPPGNLLKDRVRYILFKTNISFQSFELDGCRLRL